MSAIYILLGVIGAVWAGVFLLRGSLVTGCLGVLLTCACVGFEFLHFDLAGIPLTIDRVILLLVIAAYIVQRALGRTDPKPMSRVDWILLGFIGLLGVSSFVTEWESAQEKSEAMWRLVAGYLIPLSLYWVARQAPASQRSFKIVLAGLACFGIYLSTTAVFEITRRWELVVPSHIADPAIGLHFGRARGPMVHSVSFGLFLTACLLAAWMWRRQLSVQGRSALLLVLPVFLAGLFFSYTRSVWMGAALGVVTVLAVTLTAPWRRIVLGTMGTAAVLFALVDLESIVAFERERSASNTKQSAELRTSFAYVSWNMFLDRPIWGVGFGHFPQDKKVYIADRSTDLLLEPIRHWAHHNTLLSLLTETGIVGMGLFVAILIGWARASVGLLRNPRAPAWARDCGALTLGVLAAYLPQLIFHELSYATLDNSLVFCLAGLTVGLRAAYPADDAVGVSEASRQRRVNVSQHAEDASGVCVGEAV